MTVTFAPTDRRVGILAVAMASSLVLLLSGCLHAGDTGRASNPDQDAEPSRYRMTDPRGDVVNGDTQQRTTQAAQRLNADLVGLEARRTSDGLAVVLDYDHWRSRASTRSGVEMKIESSTGTEFYLQWYEVHNPVLQAHGKVVRRWERAAELARMTSDTEAPVRCRGLSATPQPKVGRLSVWVPSRCLEDPAWMRVSDVIARTRPGRVFYADSPFTDSANPYGHGTTRLVAPRH
jgi:hypothetical protein